MSPAADNFRAGIAALGLIDGGHADTEQALNYFTVATDQDPSMCDAWLGRILCGDKSSGTLYKAWRSRGQMHQTATRAGINPASLWAKFDIGMGIVGLEQPIYDQSALAAALAQTLATATPPDYAEALDTLREAEPTGVTEWVKAAIFYRAERWPDVIDCVNANQRLYSRDAALKTAAELAVGISHARLGKFDDAETHLRAVTEQEQLPDAVHAARWFLAMIDREHGKEDRAVAQMRQVLDHAPSAEVSAALADPSVRLQVTTVEAIGQRTDPWDPATGPSAEDVANQRRDVKRADVLAEATAELDAQIGMKDLKEQVETYRSRTRMAAKRREMGLKTPSSSNHMVFTGPPGTGKTTIARVVAKILCGLGIVETDHVEEVNAKSLLGQHLGESEANTNAAINRALNGVLFLDEAYTLISPENKGSNADAFGKAAIDTLLARIENERHRLVVIIAGYETDIDQLLAVNEGLRSRFAYRMRFSTYTPDELVQIAHALAAGRDDIIDDASSSVLRSVCAHLSSRTVDDNTDAAVADLVALTASLATYGLENVDGSAMAALRSACSRVLMATSVRKNMIDSVGNGRFIRTVVERAADCRDRRLDGEFSAAEFNETAVMTIRPPDMAAALREVLAAEPVVGGLDLSTVLGQVN